MLFDADVLFIADIDLWPDIPGIQCDYVLQFCWILPLSKDQIVFHTWTVILSCTV